MTINDISLSAGVRNSLLSLQDSTKLLNRTQTRLSTGKKVNAALDNPTNFFAAAVHLQRAADIVNHKDGIKEAIQVIKTADIGMDAMTSIFRQASAIADSAQGATSREDLVQRVDQFNEMRKQIDELAADSGYQGINLLHRQDLSVDLGNNHTLTVQGADATSSGFDQMTNGLNVEAASMDPLNIVDPNFVTTSSGSIKQDGVLTIDNNNVPGIDTWLGAAGAKNQIITSQDVTVTTNLASGSAVQAQILDNVGVAEYGNGGFELYRDTNAAAAVTAGSGSVTNTTILQTSDVSAFLGPLLSDGSKPFTLERTLSASTGVLSGTATISSTTVDNSADVYTSLGQLAGSGVQSVDLYRDMTATAAVAGDPAAVSSTSILDNSGVADFLGALVGAGSSSFSLSRDLSMTHAESSATGSVATLTMNSSSDVAQFIGPQVNNAGKALTLTYNAAATSWSSSDVANVTGIGGPPPSSVAIDLVGNGTSITANLGGAWSDGDTITITTTAGAWKSDNPAVGVSVSGNNLNLDLNGNGAADVRVSLAGALKADAVIGVNTAASNWKTTNPSVAVTASGTALGLDFNGNGSADVTVNLATLSEADSRLSATALLSAWHSNAYPGITVNPASTTLNINLGVDGTDDLRLTLGSLLYGDAKLTVTPSSSAWKTTDTRISLNQPTSGGAMTADLNGDGTNDIQLNLPSNGPYGYAWLSTEKVQAATTGPFRTTDSSVALQYNDSAKTIGLHLNGNTGAPDITINLSATWAVDNLPTSPLGNGDVINLTVDGRHRWVTGDNKTPNISGMKRSMQEVEDAINTLRMNSAKNSAGLSILTVRSDFTDNLVNILSTGSDNLTLADSNQEGANMLMLQTRQSLGITSLSLASQSAQSVLRLFQ